MLSTLLKRRAASPRSDCWPASGATLLFLHIPKTGGISLRHTLLELCGELPVYRILHPIDDHARLVAMAAEERRRFALVEGHMYYGVHARIPRPSTYVTILREPVARVLSFYRYVSRQDWHHLYNDITSKGMTLEDCYASALTVELDNFMTRALSSLDYVHVPFGEVTDEMYCMARSHLDSMSLLGITERMDLLYRLFEVHFGLKLSGPPHLNRSESLNVDLVTPRARELIVAHNQYDIKLYEYAQHLIRERAAAAGIKDSSDSVAVDRSPSSPVAREAG